MPRAVFGAKVDDLAVWAPRTAAERRCLGQFDRVPSVQIDFQLEGCRLLDESQQGGGDGEEGALA